MANTLKLKIIIDAAGNAKAGLSSIASGLGNIGAIAGGAALAGVVAIGAGLTGAGAAGLSMNNAMEQATARINAFTKDGAKTAEILEMVSDRAAKTPFAFNEMAAATAALLPSAKQAQVGLEDLIAQAEILAASNPAEGLEGAAFALKEAVSGDFTSIIERFNLPRSFINKLKEEGVPALEIVRRAMQELGLDADLVGALAETAEGRWSTFKDTLQGLAAQVTQPIFDAVSGSLGGLNEKLTAAEPALTAIAAQLAGGVKAGIAWLAELLPKVVTVFQEWGGTMNGTLGPAMVLIKDAIDRIATALGIETEKVSAQDIILKLLKATLDSVTVAVQLAAITMQGIAATVEMVSEAVTIGKGLWDQLKTIVTLATNSMKASITPWADAAVAAFDKIKSGINSVKSVIDGLISKFNAMKSAAQSALAAMASLVPHSPVVYEQGLMQITDAAKKLSDQFSTGLNVPVALKGAPTFAGAAGAAFAGAGTMAGAMAGPSPGVQVVIEYSPVVSTASAIEIEQNLIPLLIEGLRKRGVRVG